MKKSGIGKWMSVALVCILALSGMTGCGKTKVPDNEDTLEIYIQDLGYGIQWLKDEVELFKQQDWVKEKYPNLNIPDIKYNSQYGYATGQIEAGAKANSVDLLFTSADYDLQNKVDAQGNHYIESLNDVFESKVPGEDVLYKDKMFDAYEKTSKYGDTYWSTMWSASYQGFLYNAEIFEKLNLSVPRTTDEMIKLCDDVKKLNGGNAAYGKDYTIMLSTSRAEANYWQFMAFPIWWAQYEGLENYYNFFRGIDSINGTENSRDVMAQQGRLESMEVIYDLLSGYSFTGAGSIDFIEAQSRFLMGDGLIMANGDWFYQEMDTTVQGLKDRGIDYDIRFMKSPVISSIIDNLPSIGSDQTLAAVVDAIDRGETEYAGVSATDFARVKEARSFVYAGDYLNQAFIPSYATAKEVAKDFLRFLATDVGLKQFMKSTRGACLPFEYDVRTADAALYETFDNIQKYRCEIYDADPVFSLARRYEEFPLAYLGGLQVVPTGYLDSAFARAQKTAQAFFQEQIDYYNGSRWDDILRNAGKK